MHLQRVYKPPVNAGGKFCNEPVAQPFFDSFLEIRVQQQDLDYPWSQISSYVLITQPLASFLGSFWVARPLIIVVITKNKLHSQGIFLLYFSV